MQCPLLFKFSLNAPNQLESIDRKSYNCLRDFQTNGPVNDIKWEWVRCQFVSGNYLWTSINVSKFLKMVRHVQGGILFTALATWSHCIRLLVKWNCGNCPSRIFLFPIPYKNKIVQPQNTHSVKSQVRGSISVKSELLTFVDQQ